VVKKISPLSNGKLQLRFKLSPGFQKPLFFPSSSAELDESGKSFITFQFTDSFFHSHFTQKRNWLFFFCGRARKENFIRVKLLTLTGFCAFFFFFFFQTTLPIFCLPFVKPGEKAQAKVGWGWVGR
jgi:hypothetical protein